MDNELLNVLAKEYNKKFVEIELIRDWIGKVYLVKDDNQKYILKIFNNITMDSAKQSAYIMNFLCGEGVCVPKIYLTSSNELYFYHEGKVSVLYDFVEGSDIQNGENLQSIGEFAAIMHKKMKQYPYGICNHDKEYFIDRYIEILKKKNYASLNSFIDMGQYLWNIVGDAPTSFIHGDFHAGNLFDVNDKIVAFDFDAAAIASPLYDIATMCDATDYFSLDDDNFISGRSKTLSNLDEFLKGYNNHYHLSSNETKAILAFIAIRHFDIQATIIDSQGLNFVDDDFFDKQLIWLKKWKKFSIDK